MTARVVPGKIPVGVLSETDRSGFASRNSFHFELQRWAGREGVLGSDREIPRVTCPNIDINLSLDDEQHNETIPPHPPFFSFSFSF